LNLELARRVLWLEDIARKRDFDDVATEGPGVDVMKLVTAETAIPSMNDTQFMRHPSSAPDWPLDLSEHEVRSTYSNPDMTLESRAAQTGSSQPGTANLDPRMSRDHSVERAFQALLDSMTSGPPHDQHEGQQR
ncbi:hypothetical protein I317_07710, partial [Kwoniella heveanensis CBS 569]